MFIELVDDLRCPRPHEETWLVVAADRTEGRDIVTGTLGCPICQAEFPIREGVIWFAERSESAGAMPEADQRIDAELAMRLAAFLDLSEAQGLALLAGSWGAAAPLLRDIVPTHLVVLNAARVPAGSGISPLAVDAGIPLADGTCRGVALDPTHTDAASLQAAVRVLRPRGRLVAPADTPVPTGVTELARDEHLWVAEREAAPPRLVTLQTRSTEP